MSVRFRIHPNRSSTLAGVNYQDFRSILDGSTCYSLKRLMELRAKKRLTRDDRENLAFIENELKVIETIKQGIDAAIAATYPPKPPLTKAQRLKVVKEERHEREVIDSILVMYDSRVPG